MKFEVRVVQEWQGGWKRVEHWHDGVMVEEAVIQPMNVDAIWDCVRDEHHEKGKKMDWSTQDFKDWARKK